MGDAADLLYSQNGSKLAVMMFHAAAHPPDKCGSNGLPLTPNGVRMFGRSQRLTVCANW